MIGVILYGPPASGKDTVTRELQRISNAYHLYSRIKVGPGRTDGYQISTEEEVTYLRSAGEVIWENQRYNATYVVERKSLFSALSTGIPVVHLGQREAVEAVTSAFPSAAWHVVSLWCPRDEAAHRITARGTGDLDERLQAWEETVPLPTADLEINTVEHSAAQAASAVHSRVDSRQKSLSIAVPAPTFRSADGRLDRAATHHYAGRLASTWVNHVVVAGPMGRGEACTPAERAEILDLWLGHFRPHQVISACWCHEDVQVAKERGVRPLVMLQADTGSRLLDLLASVPSEGIAYANPRYSSAVFTAERLREANDRKLLPHALKLSKVSLTELRDATKAVGTGTHVLHGSSRNIASSLEAGAAMVVAAPLAALPAPWPASTISAVQASVDSEQSLLDTCSTHEDRVAAVVEQARQRMDQLAA